MIAKQENRYFEDAGQITTKPAASDDEQLSDNINSSEGIDERSKPRCYDCGSLMEWLDMGKFCPVCGRFALYPSVKRDILKHYKGVA